jgi:hypothetical protein
MKLVETINKLYPVSERYTLSSALFTAPHTDAGLLLRVCDM